MILEYTVISLLKDSWRWTVLTIDDNSYTLDPGLQPHPGSTPIPITPMDLWSKRSPNGRSPLVKPWSFCNFIVHQRPWWDGGACILIPWTQAYNLTLVPRLSLSPPWTYGQKGHQMDAHPSSNPGPFVISLCIRGLGEMGGGACTLIPWTQAYNLTLVPHLSLSPPWTYGQQGHQMDAHPLVEPWSFCNFIVHQRPWWDGGGACTLIPWTQAYNPTLVPHLSLSPPWTYSQNSTKMDPHHLTQFSYKNDNNSSSTQPIFFDDGSLDAPIWALSNGDKKKSIGCVVEKIWIIFTVQDASYPTRLSNFGIFLWLTGM